MAPKPGKRNVRMRHKSPAHSTITKCIRILRRMEANERKQYFVFLQRWWPALIAYIQPNLRMPKDAALFDLYSDSE